LVEMSINSEGKPWPQALAHDDLDWPASDQRVLAPFHEAVNLSETSELGASIAFGSDGELYLLHAVDPDEIDDSDTVRELAGADLSVQETFDVPVSTAVRECSRDVIDTAVDSHSITATVVDEDEKAFSSKAGTMKNCHTVVGTGMDSFDAPSSILVPVASGPHSGLATKIAQSIARAYDCWLELFHVIPEDASAAVQADAHDLLEAYEYRLADDVKVDHHVHEATDPAEAIIEHSEYHSVTILGAPQKGKLRRFMFGSTTDDVTEKVGRGPVLTARRKGAGSRLSSWF
jgi:nucleotide-binding universal stress UspA family protein